MKILAIAISSILFASFACAQANAQTVFTLTGEASTNSLNDTTTLGSAELKLKSNTQGTIKLTCGILGQLQHSNPDGSLAFQHTVACDDHSLFILSTRTVVTVQGGCTSRPGFKGTFHEDSSLAGVDGPFYGSTGRVSIDGTINCGFNEMKISGTISRP